MVHKTSFRGVHSGNTLRTSNTRYSRRYHSQACIVSRVHPVLLKKLTRGAAASATTTTSTSGPAAIHNNSNVAVDVALSLNKQSRWLLPAVLLRQIRSNDVLQKDLTVSMLERHKLKRPASCVSFHSNQGLVKRIQPRGGRYFAFKYPSADGQSRRALRRQQREERLKSGKKDGGGGKEGKVMVVYTELGRAKRDMELGESEVRYEVYYPSPAQSSISHNPKYIKQDVSAAPGADTEHVQQGKPKRQHRGKQRQRMSLRDLDDCDLPSWSAHADHYNNDQYSHADTSQDVGDGEMVEERRTMDCLLASLLQKAQRLQQAVGGAKAKARRSKKNDSKPTSTTGGGRHHTDNKSHIVYLENEDEENSASDSSPSLLPPAPPTPAQSTRVVLPTAEVTAQSLKDTFGQRYLEAACRPRRFVLDVTCNVLDVIKKSNASQLADEALAFLVFIHDGFYDDGEDVYKVSLNSKLSAGLVAVPLTDTREDDNDRDLPRGTALGMVSRAMDFVAGLLEQEHSPSHLPIAAATATQNPNPRQLQQHLGPTQAYVPSVQRLFRQSPAVEARLPTLAEMVDGDPGLCEVCYDDVSPLTLGSSPATALWACDHAVCDLCWSQHVHSRLHQGFVRLTCPGHTCQREVGVGALLSLAPLPTVEKLLLRQEEVRVGASPTDKWCPNEACGRVISLDAASLPSSPPSHPVAATIPTTSSAPERRLERDVVCACGAHVCFRCLSPAHWPASCAQAQQYRCDLATATLPDRNAEVWDDRDRERAERLKRENDARGVMKVEGKHCPSCKNFVLKDGGCPQMTCRCGINFCWYCTKPGLSHPDRSCGTQKAEQKLTTTVIVRHLEVSAGQDTTQKKVPPTRRQRVSLMERAVEHRHQGNQLSAKIINSLAKAVAKATFKDGALAQHVLKVCSTGTSPSLSSSPSSDLPASPSPSRGVLEAVSAFLRRVACSKREVHEVAEYSLVLLKDLPDSLLRLRALRISEDLGAFCSFTQSVFDAWGTPGITPAHPQEGVKAVTKLAEIQGWIHSALAAHVVTVRKIRSASAAADAL